MKALPSNYHVNNKLRGTFMRSILISLFLVFSVNAFAEITNGTYECTYELEADQDSSEAWSFIFDLNDDYIVVYDGAIVASILLVNEYGEWTQDSDGNSYLIEKYFNRLKITYSSTEKDEITGDVTYTDLTVYDMKKSMDGSFILKTYETEIDVHNNSVESYEYTATCVNK